MAAVNTALEVFGTIISLLLMFFCILEKRKASKEAKLLIALLATNAAVLICDMLTWVLEAQVQYEGLLYFFNSMVYILGYLIAAIFTAYLFENISQRTHISKKPVAVIGVLCAFAAALVLHSLGNHMYFRFEDGIYYRGPYYWLSQLYPIFILLADMIIILHHRKSLGMRNTLALLTYGALPVIAMAVQIMVYGITLLYLATTLSMLISYIVVHLEQSRRLQQQENELTKMSVSIMLSQIQPHFIFNALGAIKQLCHSDPPTAEKAVDSFAKYLRCNLDSLSADKPISFSAELEHTKNYLAIEKLRFQDSLSIVYDIQATGFLLPTLTLQPIVENAVCHGLMKREGGGTLTISTRETDKAYTITVKDDGVGFDPLKEPEDGRSHIGVKNVCSRLEQMRGGTLSIESTPGVGTVAVITVPKT